MHKKGFDELRLLIENERIGICVAIDIARQLNGYKYDLLRLLNEYFNEGHVPAYYWGRPWLGSKEDRLARGIALDLLEILWEEEMRSRYKLNFNWYELYFNL